MHLQSFSATFGEFSGEELADFFSENNNHSQRHQKCPITQGESRCCKDTLQYWNVNEQREDADLRDDAEDYPLVIF